MNGFDVVLLLVLAGSVLNGFRQGFIVQIASIVGVVIGLAVARQEYVDVRHAITSVAPHGPWTTVVAYLIVFLVVWTAVVLVARRIRFLVRLMLLGPLDRLGGALIGLLEGIVVAVLLVYVGDRVHNHNLHTAIHQSTLGPRFGQFNRALDRFFPHIP